MVLQHTATITSGSPKQNNLGPEGPYYCFDSIYVVLYSDYHMSAHFTFSLERGG